MLALLFFPCPRAESKAQGGGIANQRGGGAPNAAMAHSSSFGDTTYTKVFVGGLAWETGRETMRSYFEQFGEILEAVVITDRQTGRSKGYGFVTFKDEESARRACADPTPIIDGRRANCNLASLGQKPRQGRGPRLEAGPQGAGPGFPSFPQQNPYAYPPNPQPFTFQPFGFSQPHFDSSGAYGFQQQQFPYGQQGYITGPAAGFQNPPGGPAYGGYPTAFGQFPQQQGFVGGGQPGALLQPVYPVLGQQQMGGGSGQHFQGPGQPMPIPQPLPQGPGAQSAQPGGQQQYTGQQQYSGLIPGGNDGSGPTG